MGEERSLSATGTCAPSRRSSGGSIKAKPVVEEVYGPYGPIGRCPTIVLPKSNRLVRHREAFVDESLFGRKPGLPQPQKPKEKEQEDLEPEGTEGEVSRTESLKDAASNLRPKPRSARPPSFARSMLGRSVAPPPDNTSLMSVETRTRQKAACERSRTARSGLSAIQKWQTRFRPVRARSSEVEFGLFAPMEDSLYWAAKEEWYEEGDFAKGKHGMFDTDAVQSVNDTDVIQCLYVKRMPPSKK